MKKTLFILLFILITSLTAQAAPLYKEVIGQTVTSGVTITTEKRFYGDYALEINCVKADLKNSFLSLELLKHNGGSDKTQTVYNLAKEEEKTVVAINGDFFSAYKGDQNFSLGLEIKDGQLLQSHINPDMAAGFLKGNVLELSYVDFKGTITAPDGTTMPIAHINKPTDYYGALLIYTPEFNGAVSPFLPEGITAVTVADGVITTKGVSVGGVLPIPENGYIMAIDDNMTPFLEYKFNIGDKVLMDIGVTPAIKDIKTAFGGGTILLSDGQKTKITHNVAGNNPRSAIGTNDDGTVIYMITVDGRQSQSRGVSLDVLADICLEMGMVNAINLDGGGSTAMVGRTFENDELHYINNPSEKRKVINALAVTSSAQRGKAVGAVGEAAQENVLKGDFVELKVYPYDKNMNAPSSVDSPIKWVVAEGKGYVRDNKYYADGSGKTVLELYYGTEKTDTCTVNVIDKVCGITADKNFELSLEKPFSLDGKIEVFDSEGNSARVNNIELLSPVYDKSFISLEENRIKLLKSGTGYLTLSASEASREIGLCTGENSIALNSPKTDDFMMKEESGGFNFKVCASAGVRTLFEKIVYARAMDIMRKADASAVVGGDLPADLTKGITPHSAKGWSEKDYPHLKVLSMKMASGIITRGDQWKKLSQALEDAKQKNIILLLDGKMGFASDIDKKAFEEMLGAAAEKKNVFVVYNGDENFCRINDGVRYISIADVSYEPTMQKAISNTKYLSFNITENGASYSFKNLYK